MEQRTQPLTNFIQKEHFELNRYVTHLFDSYRIGFNKEQTLKESYQQINLQA